MLIAVLATSPTDSNTEGFLPAAVRRGNDILLLTDQPEEHHRSYAGSPLEQHVQIVGCDVRDHSSVLSTLDPYRVCAVFSGSDHLQVQAALAADYLGLPGKDWRAAWATNDKAAMRSLLSRSGVDTVWSLSLGVDAAPPEHGVPFPVVVKPRQGVASEDVELCVDERELAECLIRIRARRPGTALMIEEFLPGDLRTLETLGDGERRHVLGGFRTTVSAPPRFIEEDMTFEPDPDPALVAQVLEALDALGVGFGICHTEYVVHEGRTRLIEVNYRAIGDQCDLLLAELLDIPLFDLALGVHCGDSLPDSLEQRTDGRARITYVCATDTGTLVNAPVPSDVEEASTTLTYRPMREIGTHASVTGTNRDYIGVVRAHGRNQAGVDAAVAGFVAQNSWVIR